MTFSFCARRKSRDKLRDKTHDLVLDKDLLAERAFVPPYLRSASSTHLVFGDVTLSLPMIQDLDVILLFKTNWAGLHCYSNRLLNILLLKLMVWSLMRFRAAHSVGASVRFY